jgi:hypothetical protein
MSKSQSYRFRVKLIEKTSTPHKKLHVRPYSKPLHWLPPPPPWRPRARSWTRCLHCARGCSTRLGKPLCRRRNPKASLQVHRCIWDCRVQDMIYPKHATARETITSNFLFIGSNNMNAQAAGTTPASVHGPPGEADPAQGWGRSQPPRRRGHDGRDPRLACP